MNKVMLMHKQIDKKFEEGLTALMYAVYSHTHECIRPLHELGADLNVQDPAGLTVTLPHQGVEHERLRAFRGRIATCRHVCVRENVCARERGREFLCLLFAT